MFIGCEKVIVLVFDALSIKGCRLYALRGGCLILASEMGSLIGGCFLHSVFEGVLQAYIN